jgi:hypothetical protein
MALAVSPAAAFGQELPALPGLPPLPALPDFIPHQPSPALPGFQLPGPDALPMPGPYPFGNQGTQPVTATQVVRILGLNGKTPSVAQGVETQQTIATHQAPNAAEVASSEPQMPRFPAVNAVVAAAVSPAIPREPVTLASAGEGSKGQVRAAAAVGPVNKPTTETYKLSDSSPMQASVPNGELVVENARSERKAAVAVPEPPSLSLIDIEISLDNGTSATAPVPTIIPPTPASPQNRSPGLAKSSGSPRATDAVRPSDVNAPARGTAKPAVLEAPSLPFDLAVGADAKAARASSAERTPSERTASERNRGLKLESLAPSSEPQAKRPTETMSASSGSAVEMDLSTGAQTASKADTKSKGRNGEEKVAFSLKDASGEVVVEAQAPLMDPAPPTALYRSSLVADGLRLSRGDTPSPRPMRVMVEGEPELPEPLAAAKPADSPGRIVPPVQLAASRSQGAGTPLVREAIHPVSAGNRASAERTQASLPQRSKPNIEITGEMRQGPAINVHLRDVSMRQADAPIADLSVEQTEICRLIQTGPATYTILGLEAGTTRIAVITSRADGKHDVQISQVTVDGRVGGASKGVSELAQEISHSLALLYPQYAIDVDFLDKSLIVQGEVGSEAEAKQVLNLVRKASLLPVIDRLKSPTK